MIRLSHVSLTMGALALVVGAPLAQEPTPGYRAYEAYAACMEGHVDELTKREGSPERIADKIGRLCQTQLIDLQIAATQDQLDLGLDSIAAAREANLVVQQLTMAAREATIARVVTARLTDPA